MAVSDFVLAVEIVPDVQHSVHSRHEEYPCPRRAEATACEVRAVILQAGVVGHVEMLSHFESHEHVEPHATHLFMRVCAKLQRFLFHFLYLDLSSLEIISTWT